jgi:hypothetical protein
MKEKKELPTNFNFFQSQRWKCCRKKLKVYAIFLSWKLLKLSPQIRFKVFFQKKIPSVPVKHHFSYLSLHFGMTQSFPCTYGPIYHGTIFFYFLGKYLKKFFVLPGLPSNEKNSSDHHNSYNKDPNLAFFSFTESPSNFLQPTYHKIPKKSYHIFLSQVPAQNNKWHFCPPKSFRG